MRLVVQERPCTRCIKRNISHLCHDEPREPEQATTKKAKRQHSIPVVEENGSTEDRAQENSDEGLRKSPEVPRDPAQATTLSIGPSASPIIQPSPVSGIGANALYTNRRSKI